MKRKHEESGRRQAGKQAVVGWRRRRWAERQVREDENGTPLSPEDAATWPITVTRGSGVSLAALFYLAQLPFTRSTEGMNRG